MSKRNSTIVRLNFTACAVSSLLSGCMSLMPTAHSQPGEMAANTSVPLTREAPKPTEQQIVFPEGRQPTTSTEPAPTTSGTSGFSSNPSVKVTGTLYRNEGDVYAFSLVNVNGQDSHRTYTATVKADDDGFARLTARPELVSKPKAMFWYIDEYQIKLDAKTSTQARDFVFEYKIADSLEDLPGEETLTFPLFQRESKKVIEYVALPGQPQDRYPAPASTLKNIDWSKAQTATFGGEPTIKLQDLTERTWYAYRVTLALPDGTARTSVNAFLVGRKSSDQIKLPPTPSLTGTVSEILQ